MIRFEVISNKTYDQILEGNGYKKSGELYVCDGIKYKIAWLHKNSWNQLAYIDIIECNN